MRKGLAIAGLFCARVFCDIIGFISAANKMTTATAISVTTEWTNVNLAVGASSTDVLFLQSVSWTNDYIELAVSDSQPSSDFSGVMLTPNERQMRVVGSVWARTITGYKQKQEVTAKLQVQIGEAEVANYQFVNAQMLPETVESKTLVTDAWSRMKAVHDVSVFHGMFTESIPVALWREVLDGVEQPSFTYSSSVNGKMRLTSSTNLNERTGLCSFRNPRYEPNRGHLYSISAFIPNKAAAGERSFGIFTEESGAFFRVKSDGNLYAVVRTEIDSVIQEDEDLIDLPPDIDIEKGWTYDIQFQWRGVGAYFFYVGQRLVHVIDTQGTRTNLTMWNPAAPAAFECINHGDVVAIECGCVDITSEGGKENGKTYGSIGYNNESGQTENAITGFNVPILVVRNKLLFNGRTNTRDVIALLATAYGDQRDFLRIWSTRDETAISLNGQTWTDFGDGHLEYINYRLDADGNTIAEAMTFDTSKATKVFGSRVDQDQSYSTSALFEGRTDIWQTPGDIFIFTMHRETAGQTKVGVTYEFAEAI